MHRPVPHISCRSFAAIVALTLLAAPSAFADNYVSQGPFVFPQAGSLIPNPGQVPGKEYSDVPDKDDANPPVVDPLQVLNWDGVGGTVNGFDFSGTFFNDTVIDDPGRNVDALAATTDALFTEVRSNQSALLLSATGDPVAPVRFHTTGGAVGTWATIAQIDLPGNDAGVVDLDGLEMWGIEPGSDGNLFSLEGDPGAVAVWRFDGTFSTPYIQKALIANAIGGTSVFEQLDLDALMSNQGGILFSIRPIPNGPFDGGEIWFWDLNPNNPATFLVHGGRTWDTANDVFALLGNENIDGLEAVSAAIPEPGTFSLSMLAALGLFAIRRKR